MMTRAVEELIEETLDRLKRYDVNRQDMEPLKVKISHLRTLEIWAWASAAWAVDERGTVYYKYLVDDEDIWYPIPPDRLMNDSYEHMLTGLKIVGEPRIAHHSA